MRNYKKERENYHSRPEQMARNAARKRARRQMEKEGKAEKGDGKDVHHKDNNPLNNDKKNLSLVTQHYNRREPRLRVKTMKIEAIRRTLEANAVSMSNPDAKVMIALMQKYINTTNPKLKTALLKKINQLQSKLGLKVTEDMGSVTGPHIAGTGDDSSTVVVRKKKKLLRRVKELAIKKARKK